jgi:hypothetical protein
MMLVFFLIFVLYLGVPFSDIGILFHLLYVVFGLLVG